MSKTDVLYFWNNLMKSNRMGKLNYDILKQFINVIGLYIFYRIYNPIFVGILLLILLYVST